MSEAPPDRTPGVPIRVTSQALDVLLKLEAEQLIAILPARFGLPLAPLRRLLPTELPQVDFHLERLDSVGELEDGSIVHLEFQGEPGLADVRRFLRYGLGLTEVYADRSVQGVVFCGSRTRSVPAAIDLPPFRYRLSFVRLADQDGEAILARLRALATGDRPWSEMDRMDLVLLPLLRLSQDTEGTVREGLAMAQRLPVAWQPRAMGALLALAYHLKGEELLNRLVEELMGTNLLDQILAEKLEQRFAQGVKEGIEQGMERGLEQGMERGRAEGERAQRAMLQRYLEQRFGTIPAALEQRIAAADAAALAALFDQAVRAGTIDAL